LVKEEVASRPTKDLANLKALGEGRICKKNHNGSCKAQRTYIGNNLQAKPH
jgi:hypothetical protein